MAAQTDRGIPLSALNPKFLHTNSTSHTWPFSAFAELIDNAYDASAKQFWIDKTAVRGQDCLTFMDNGAGMDYDKMHKMLSFGFSDKETINKHVPVGLYGNGFKSGSMRLGKDAIVFSKHGESMCVGLLSQTYLHETQAENVIVPIVSFRRFGQSIQSEPQHTTSLQDILRYSLFKTESELISELDAINAHCASESTGTRIIIWNIRKTSTDKSEFDFETDRYDIQISPDVSESEKEKYKQPSRVLQSRPESDFSLRAYCSILYLKPKMQIIVRGQKVKTQLISKSLAHIGKDRYKPTFLNRENIPITFGYNTKSKEHYGVMMYHKNRLIKAYERVGCQKKANGNGVGVIAVIECNFLKPTHNKQDFDYTEEYRKTICTLGGKLEDYWKAIRHKKGLDNTVPMEDIPKRPDQQWVQCDSCLKWRKLPDGFDMNKLPDKWFCRQNPDPLFRLCETPEEAEDSEDETSSCLKIYKQHERNLKKQQELKKNQTPSSPRSPMVSCNQEVLLESEPENMPVISNVVSLSTPKRMKRNLALSHSQAAKKTRKIEFNDYCTNSPNRPPASTATLDVITSPSETLDSNENNVSEYNVDCEEEDDIVIDETHSTPRPKPFDLSKVKTEESTSETDVGLYMKSSDSKMENETEDTRKEASTSEEQTSISTQTERLLIKTEENKEISKEVGKTEREETEKDARAMEKKLTQVESKISNNAEITRLNSVASVELPRPYPEDKCHIPEENTTSSEQHVKSDVKKQEGMKSSTISIPLCSDVQTDLLPSSEAQKQQDNLLELLEFTAQERDEFRDRVHEKDVQLLKLNEKKDYSHQSVQTDPSEEQNYKTLYLQAKQSIQELTKERDELKQKEELKLLEIKAEKEAHDKVCCDRLRTEREGHSSTATVGENINTEAERQVHFLLEELDTRNTECNELRSKLESLEQEKSDHEQLQKEVEELRRQREEWTNANKVSNRSSEQTCSTSAAANLVNAIIEESNERPIEGDNAVTSAKLRQLRRSVAHLLVTFVPALDLDQVNYDCEVIDEILDQVIAEIPPS